LRHIPNYIRFYIEILKIKTENIYLSEYIQARRRLMLALLVVDVQNEFSGLGLRAVPNHDSALSRISQWVTKARELKIPIAWVKHHNRPNESHAFVPGTWGAELSPGMGPQDNSAIERLFEKDVYGAFTGTEIEEWLRSLGITETLIVGFFTHMCLSTAAREGLIRGFQVYLDPEATGARDLHDAVLGSQSADEVRRSAILQLLNMGAQLIQMDSPLPHSTTATTIHENHHHE
jgi:nicotinamidase-related amidase